MPEAVPNIEAEPLPAAPLFTWEEYRQIPLTARGKFAKFVVGARATNNINREKIGILKDWGNNIFSGKTPREVLKEREGKAPPPKWQFWKR